jgi:hypothetical protein
MNSRCQAGPARFDCAPVPEVALPPVRLVVTLAALAALSACDKPKNREAAQRAAAAREPLAPILRQPSPAQAPRPPGSANLAKAKGVAGFYVDFIDGAKDPLNNQPAKVAAGVPIVIGGFGFDAVVKRPAKAVDVVIDGKAYGAPYGAPRPDVAAFYKTPALTNVGYKVTLPADAAPKGEHTLVVRVVAADGRSYQDSVPIPFVVG